MQSYRHDLKATVLAALVFMAPNATTAQASDDQIRVAREMIRTLEAYAVYKMGQYDLAFERYLSLAEDGRIAMEQVESAYRTGKGVQKDTERAEYWEMRARAGD